MDSVEQIIKTFSYTTDEQLTFPYIRKYMEKMSSRLDKVNDHQVARRFMLAGLFLTYRAFNHSGLPMSTEDLDSMLDSIHKTRLRTYAEVSGKRINNTDEYLTEIKFTPLKTVFPGTSQHLYRFVING